MGRIARPDDIIGPRVLTPGGMLVLGGAPKVGKSDLVISWLVHMAAGVPFLGFTPPRPLRVFYLQAEIQYHYLRERLQQLRLAPALVARARDTLVVTTSGITGLIDPTGRVTMKVTEPGPAVGVVQLGLRTGTTTASWLATPLEVTATVAAALWITALTLTPSPRRRFHPLVGS